MLATLLTLVCVTNATPWGSLVVHHEVLDPIEAIENDLDDPRDVVDLCEALTGTSPDESYVTEDTLDTDSDSTTSYGGL